jgi:hypothetical protein
MDKLPLVNIWFGAEGRRCDGVRLMGGHTLQNLLIIMAVLSSICFLCFPIPALLHLEINKYIKIKQYHLRFLQ